MKTYSSITLHLDVDDIREIIKAEMARVMGDHTMTNWKPVINITPNGFVGSLTGIDVTLVPKDAE